MDGKSAEDDRNSQAGKVPSKKSAGVSGPALPTVIKTEAENNYYFAIVDK